MDRNVTRLHQLERAALVAALSLATLLAWWYLIQPAPMRRDNALGTILAYSPMWAVMMVAMMLPSATPMILTYFRVRRPRESSNSAILPEWLFTAGYLLVWIGFAIIAAMAQWVLHQSQLLSSGMGHLGPLAGGGLLAAAGTFQFSSLKQACLDQCRSPIGFIMTEWREGPAGSLIMGLRLGAFCTGCCWALMLLMFVGGVMSLAGMAALAVFFLAEKCLREAYAGYLRTVSGSLLLLGGAVMMALGALGTV